MTLLVRTKHRTLLSKIAFDVDQNDVRFAPESGHPLAH
jgi:hypothetical protein